ncbi:MAG: hypothetical protein LQ339_005979 [Xanthoria mediterranea]|nr:MAG: hypothetical protein LQ339_005979 [Xanthoria mediterranea]
MLDTDIELGQSSSKSMPDHPYVESSEPESFYRDANAIKGMTGHPPSSPSSWVHVIPEEKDAPPRESLKEDPSTRPVVPPRTQKPQTKASTDDIDPKNLRTEHRNLKKEYEDARQELRTAWRENREQSLELRDLKKQNAHLKESLHTQADPKSYKDQIMSERRKFYEHVDLLEDHIAHLKHQLEKTKLHMDQLTFQTREANEEKAAYETKLQNLQKQNTRLNEDLTECRDDILRLQPPSQIPDSKIAEEYSSLYQQIASWVDDEADDTQSMEARMADLATDKEAPELLEAYLDADLIRLAKKYSDAEPLVLRYIIQLHLHRIILADDIYLFGLDEHNITMLRSVEHAMDALEPKRDTLTIQRWRSETLQALAKIDGFQSEQQRQATIVSKELWAALTYLLPELATDGESGWKRLHEMITTPAVRLATNMRFSTSCYRIIAHLPRNSSSSSSHGNNNVIYHPDIQRYTILDVATQKVLRQDSVLKIAEDGRIGEYVMVVQPLLLRMQRDSHGGIALCKPTVAIKLDEPMAKKAKGVRALGALSSWFGGEQEPARS